MPKKNIQKNSAKSQKKLTSKDFEEMIVYVFDDERLNDTIDEVLFLSQDVALYDVEAIIDYLRTIDSLARIAVAVNGAHAQEWATCPHQRAEGSDEDYGEGDPASCCKCSVDKRVSRYLRNYRNFKPRSKKDCRSVKSYAKNILVAKWKEVSKAEAIQ